MPHARQDDPRSSKLSQFLYRLRTESNTPRGHALSVGLGALIGCFPIYGLHLPICVVVGKLLRLNRVEMVLATNLNNPVVGPFLVFVEIQLGSLLLQGDFRPLTLEAMKSLSLKSVLAETVVGSFALGTFLAVILGVATYRLAAALAGDEFENLLVETTAERFLPSGFLSWERIRAALRFDRMYIDFIREHWFPSSGTLVEASGGCGVLLALTDVYSGLGGRGVPAGWPAVPSELRLVGLLPDPKRVRKARRALDEAARIEPCDIRRAEFPTCEALALVDVLDRFSDEERARVLDRATAALAPDGLLLVRRRGLLSAGKIRRQIDEIREQGLELEESRTSWGLLSRRHLLLARRPDPASEV